MNPAQLIRRLADGRRRSLRALSLDRAAAARLVQYGKELGIAVRADGDGLRIDGGLDLLDERALARLPHLFRLLLPWTVDSTNRMLLAEAAPPAGLALVCLAEQQTAGRGRLGRNWFSPFGCNLYLSIAWLFAERRAPAGLSIALGVEVAECLNELLPGAPVRLKWPNDLLLRGAKTGGILIEMRPEAGASLAVCGLGLNVRMPDPKGSIGQQWSDLAAAGFGLSRTELARRLLLRLLPFLAGYAGVAACRERFQALDAYYGRQVRLLQPEGDAAGIIGVDAGIDEEGALLVVKSGGELCRYRHGEVSLRPPDALVNREEGSTPPGGSPE